MPGYNGYRIVARHTNVQELYELNKFDGDLTTLKTILDKIETVQKEFSEIISMLPKAGKFLIWGGGMHTEILYHTTDLFEPSERCFHIFDSDLLKVGRNWRGIPISNSEKIQKMSWDKFEGKLILSTYQHQMEMEGIALASGFTNDKIVKFYSETNSC